MTELQQGGNAAVPPGTLTVDLGWTAPAGVEADGSAYLLLGNGRVRGDADMIFYNQSEGDGGAIRFATRTGAGGRFTIDPARLSGEVERIVFCVTIDEATARRQTLAMLQGVGVTLAGQSGDTLSFRPSLAGATEAAMMLAELYRRGGQWKFRAIGQGFNGGLGPLARSFGIDVADEPAAPPPPPAAPPPAAPPPPPPAPPPPPSISLSKVTLEKQGQTVSLQKRGSSFGEVTINLNWSRGKKGFFGGGSAIDLDLGCLYELSDGRKGVVQALGNSFGSYNSLPFIALSGDDRTGDVSQGETIRVNGGQWSAIRRIAIFANIYEGVPNWQATDGVVLVTMPDQPPIEVRMTEGRNDRRLCGIVLIENIGGQMKVTRIVDYVRDQQVLDEQLGWGLRWVAGRK
ncbi:universal stress protein [Sphingomonas sp. Leaf407]|uniref:TerD family protein n=1 Tax=unclassified Sphingomonas TaxID=196159 RepID=UPI000700B2E8|nr:MULTISPECIES: TerD family protein [unclassified Sphingomonas]KQN34852.1 universal stress protein [Sphingomonas sp. Leaf42]KQT25404.1 universal stress protein [Sphingomonas sp. Leaf407]